MNFVLQGSCFYPWLHEYGSADGNIQDNKSVYSGVLQSEMFCPLISEASSPLSQQISVLREKKVGIHIVSRVQRSVYQ